MRHMAIRRVAATAGEVRSAPAEDTGTDEEYAAAEAES
jgi:hypothetical protein